MDYKVVATKDAEEDLERFIKYLIIEKQSMQAAENDESNSSWNYFVGCWGVYS